MINVNILSVIMVSDNQLHEVFDCLLYIAHESLNILCFNYFSHSPFSFFLYLFIHR